ncbi:FecR family protein [Litoribaculum gwangyangense]
MNEIFPISRLLIKKKLNVLNEHDRMQFKKFNEKYPFLKEVNVEDLLEEIEAYSDIDKEQAWKSIQNKYQNRKNKSRFVITRRSWFKYASAAIVVGIVTTFLFKKEIFQSKEEITPIIVNTNQDIIYPGTDKATLTLGDGSVVALEKGNDFETKSAHSDGQKIIYNHENKNTSKITYNYLTIPRGGQFYLRLSDGTQVWLNSESQLKYPVSFNEGETRVVELIYGEAYFDVSPSNENKGSRFKVLNKLQEVEVLGTEFNIKAYNDDFNIYTTLVEGEVAVTSGEQSKKLSPNHQTKLHLESHKITVHDVDAKSETSWRNGVFSFREKPLKDIMKVISRWYDVNVVFENKDLESITFKGVLGKNQDLETILETIKNLSIIKNYEIHGKQIILK